MKAAKAGRFRKPDTRARSRFVMSAEERAAFIAAVNAGQIPSPPEYWFASSDYDAALKVWNDLAPGLVRKNALDVNHRYTFATFCTNAADWAAADREIKAKGEVYVARNTVNMDKLQKQSPWVNIRQRAFENMLKVGALFGLDPSNLFKLLRDEALVAGQGSLFGWSEVMSSSATSEADATDPTGILSRNASPPPRPN